MDSTAMPIEIWADVLEDDGQDTSDLRAAIAYCLLADHAVRNHRSLPWGCGELYDYGTGVFTWSDVDQYIWGDSIICDHRGTGGGWTGNFGDSM